MADKKTLFGVKRRIGYEDWRGADEWWAFSGLRLSKWTNHFDAGCVTDDRLAAVKVREKHNGAVIVEFTLAEKDLP